MRYATRQRGGDKSLHPNTREKNKTKCEQRVNVSRHDVRVDAVVDDDKKRVLKTNKGDNVTDQW